MSQTVTDDRFYATDEIRASTVEATHPTFIGYGFWLLGMFGAHRFYFGKPISGAIYFFTLGLVGVGWIVDLFLIPSMAEQANRRYRVGELDHTLMWIVLTFLGVFGVHHFVMGKWVMGLIYLCTAGVVGFGVAYDFVTLNEQIERYNAARRSV